jgi:DNA-binding FadR family transcriptional regulator
MTEPVTRIEFDEPIVRESVAEMVVRRILDMVRAGVLKAGDQLPPERELALSLNVSRPSVREAMRGLTVLGVVRSRQGGGAYISELDAEALLGPIQFFLSLQDMNIRELYDARSLIESDVARRAAENIGAGELAQLEAILAAQADTLEDPIAFRKSDYAFAASPGDWKLVRFAKEIHVEPQDIPCASWRLAATSRSAVMSSLAV